VRGAGRLIAAKCEHYLVPVRFLDPGNCDTRPNPGRVKVLRQSVDGTRDSREPGTRGDVAELMPSTLFQCFTANVPAATRPYGSSDLWADCERQRRRRQSPRRMNQTGTEFDNRVVNLLEGSNGPTHGARLRCALRRTPQRNAEDSTLDLS